MKKILSLSLTGLCLGLFLGCGEPHKTTYNPIIPIKKFSGVVLDKNDIPIMESGKIKDWSEYIGFETDLDGNVNTMETVLFNKRDSKGYIMQLKEGWFYINEEFEKKGAYVVFPDDNDKDGDLDIMFQDKNGRPAGWIENNMNKNPNPKTIHFYPQVSSI